jgi:hypothetical protein
MFEKNSEQEPNFEKPAEIQVSQDFVKSFFLEVLKAEKSFKKKAKHEKKKIEKKPKYSKPIKYKTEEARLFGEAQQIQELEEKSIEIPIPIPKHPEPKTLGRIVLPPPPRPPASLTQPLSSPETNFFDLGALNELVQDVEVTLIQCDGQNTPIKINKRSIFGTTNIVLSNEEISDIIRKFAARAQVALTEPIFRAQIQGLAITAIISPYTGSRFVIVKR